MGEVDKENKPQENEYRGAYQRDIISPEDKEAIRDKERDDN
jgi:hypothetical protein